MEEIECPCPCSSTATNIPQYTAQYKRMNSNERTYLSKSNPIFSGAIDDDSNRFVRATISRYPNGVPRWDEIRMPVERNCRQRHPSRIELHAQPLFLRLLRRGRSRSPVGMSSLKDPKTNTELFRTDHSDAVHRSQHGGTQTCVLRALCQTQSWTALLSASEQLSKADVVVTNLETAPAAPSWQTSGESAYIHLRKMRACHKRTPFSTTARCPPSGEVQLRLASRNRKS